MARKKSEIVPASNLKKLLQKGNRAPYDTGIKPMLASLSDEAFDSPEWIFEIKWDGYRAIAGIKNGIVELQSRNNLSFNKKYYPVTEALKKWNVNAIVDGEIIAVTDDGITDFQSLQAWQKTGQGHLQYYVFDILWLDGISLMHLPLLERKEILQAVITPDDIINTVIISKGPENNSSTWQ